MWLLRLIRDLTKEGKSMIKKIALGVAVVLVAGVGVILAMAATKPDEFRVERSATIQAPPDKIFALINDFQKWGEWSPWEKVDPKMKRTFSGPQAGPGAVYAWEGNDEVGSGRMEILSVEEPNNIKIKLDFIKPFEGHNIAEFTMKPQGAATNVTWKMYGPNDMIGKVMSVVINCDKMCGDQFLIGLNNLKEKTEVKAVAAQ